MNIFIPTKADHLRLVNDWQIELAERYWMHNLLWALYPDDTYAQREKRIRDKEKVTIPAGTVIKIMSMRITMKDGANSAVGIKTVVSPDSRFSQKKYGGTGGGAVSFYVPVHVLNGLEVEAVDLT